MPVFQRIDTQQDAEEVASRIRFALGDGRKYDMPTGEKIQIRDGKFVRTLPSGRSITYDLPGFAKLLLSERDTWNRSRSREGATP